jgi:ubiquinone/menaquinone biosynthesis C-methylase UbiE
MRIRERLLGSSAGWNLWKKVIAADRATAEFVREFVCPAPGEWILDVGCGTGDTIDHLDDDVTYVGIDFNPAYIESAAKKHPRGRFIVASVDDLPGLGLDRFDRVIAQNMLQRLVASLPAVMNPGARFVTSDNVWTEDQGATARVLIALDRGRNVREAPRYAELISAHFDDVEYTIRHDMLRIPYTHCLVQGRLPGA